MKKLYCLLTISLYFTIIHANAQDVLKYWSMNGQVLNINKKADSLYFNTRASVLQEPFGNSMVLNPVTMLPVASTSLITALGFSSISDGSSGYYVVSYNQDTVGSYVNRILHYTSSGALDRSTDIRTNSIVNDFDFDGDVVFLAGRFSLVNGQSRLYAAAVDMVNGNVLPFNPIPDENCTDIRVAGNLAFIQGAFFTIGGVQRSRVAIVNKVSGAVVGSDLRIRDGSAGNQRFGMKKINNFMYLYGQFDSIQNQSLHNIVRFNSSNGQLDSWAPQESGLNFSTGCSYCVVNSVFEYLSNIYVITNVINRNGINNNVFKLDASTGQTLASGNYQLFGSISNSRSYNWTIVGDKVYYTDFLIPTNYSIFTIKAFSLSDLTAFSVPSLTFTSGVISDLYINQMQNRLLIYGNSISIDVTPVPNQFAIKESNDSIFSNPSNSNFRQMKIKGEQAYYCGSFIQFARRIRNCYASLNLRSNDISIENADINLGGEAAVNDMIVLDNKVYLAGSFQNVGRLARTDLAVVDRQYGDLVSSFNSELLTNGGLISNIELYQNKLYAIGKVMHDTIDAYNLCWFDANSGNYINFRKVGNFRTNNSSTLVPSTKKAMKLLDSTLFFIEDNFLDSSYIRALNVRNDVLYEKKAICNGTVNKIDGSGNILVITGNFNRVNGVFCRGIAILDATSLQPLPWSAGITSPEIQIVEPDKVYVSGQFRDNANQDTQGAVKYSVCYTPAPVVSVSGPTTFCYGGSVVLTASPATNGQGYLWSEGSTSQSITVTTSGDFTVNYTGGLCNSAKSISVKVIMKTLETDSTFRRICDGQVIQFYGQTLTASGVYRHLIPSTVLGRCDSLKILRLQVQPFTINQVSRTICEGNYLLLSADTLRTAGIYNAQLLNRYGCDSSVRLTLRVQPVQFTYPVRSICSNSVFVFNRKVLFRPGTYLDTIQTNAGCDSIILLTLNLVPVTGYSYSAVTCGNQPYVFNGRVLTQSGTYEAYLINRRGCDSTVRLSLQIVPDSRTVINASICEGQAYNFGSRILRYSGTFTDSLINQNLCDSIVTLRLTVYPIYNQDLRLTVCAGSVVPFKNQFLTSSGVYYDTLRTRLGCDSLVRFTLTVVPVYNQTINRTICSNQFIRFNGGNLNTAGTYNARLTSSGGCDSAVTLILSVRSNTSSVFSASVCRGDSYRFNGRQLSLAGTYVDTLVNADGCDSLVTLFLQVRNKSFYNLQANICEGSTYYFQGRDLRISGSYMDTLTNDNGCDSVITLLLNVNPQPYTNIIRTICSGSSYLFNGQLLTETGEYRYVLRSLKGCDSLIVLSLATATVSKTYFSAQVCEGTSYSFRGRNLSNAGIYYDTLKTNNGCDSVVVLTLSYLLGNRITTNAVVCENSAYSFNGRLIYEAGVYLDTTVSPSGCFSFNVLNLRQSVPPSPAILEYNKDTIYTRTLANGYIWLRNKQVILGQRKAEIVGDADGEFQVILLNADGCASDTSAGLRLINLPKYPAYVSAYPNPFRDEFTVSFNTIFAETAFLSITDVLGKVVWDKDITIPKVDKQYAISGIALARGIYSLHIKTAQGNYVLKIVKE